ncbi:multidrug efflux SMR transporter [bacterium]|jgi:small multidrug resistance pump|nr:multidrug efflux SMR transporter [bacterium]MDC0362260.1 multidrug efflux SMR transporter [Halioglobus sp.]
MSHFYLAIAIVAEVVATSALKSSDGFSRTLPSIIVLLGYGVSFYYLSLVLKVIPIGVAYAIWSGAGIALVTLIGLFLFDQKLDIAAMVGISLIIAGVIVMNVFSNTVGH